MELKDLLNYYFKKFDKECEEDHLIIENRLVRMMSECRCDELKNTKLPDGFNQRLLNQLEIESMEKPSAIKRFMEVSFSFEYPVYKLVLTSILFVIISMLYISNHDTNKTSIIASEKKVNIHSTPPMSEAEKKLLRSLKENPNNIELLLSLERVYIDSGNEELAAEIHSLIEISSR